MTADEACVKTQASLSQLMSQARRLNLHCHTMLAMLQSIAVRYPEAVSDNIRYQLEAIAKDVHCDAQFKKGTNK